MPETCPKDGTVMDEYTPGPEDPLEGQARAYKCSVCGQLVGYMS